MCESHTTQHPLKYELLSGALDVPDHKAAFLRVSQWPATFSMGVAFIYLFSFMSSFTSPRTFLLVHSSSSFFFFWLFFVTGPESLIPAFLLLSRLFVFVVAVVVVVIVIVLFFFFDPFSLF